LKKEEGIVLKESLKSSEEAREDLKATIKETLKKIETDTEKTEQFQQILISENEELNKQIASLREK
jgi:hypothetical protein